MGWGGSQGVQGMGGQIRAFAAETLRRPQGGGLGSGGRDPEGPLVWEFRPGGRLRGRGCRASVGGGGRGRAWVRASQEALG